jgi:hypothetical protein
MNTVFTRPCDEVSQAQRVALKAAFKIQDEV